MNNLSQDGKSNRIRSGKAAPYPRNSPAELDAVSLFNYLLNKTHIKADIKSLDKNPNGDGILDYTNEENFALGKFEVQVKTLKKKDYNVPKYQCEIEFLSHCHNTNLPVLLIAVNVREEIAYWLHIDNAVIDDAEERLRKNANSISIPIPPENIVSKTHLEYLTKWKKIVLDDVALRKQSIELKNSYAEKEQELTEIRKKLGPPLILSNKEIRIFQVFIDEFNRLLDNEFNSIKAVQFPDYWKFGVGIVDKFEESYSFFLLPIAYGSNEGMIRQLDQLDKTFDLKYFRTHQALMFLSRSVDTLEKDPTKQAYKLLQSEILRNVENYQFSLPDVYLANEFLSSFVETFRVWLGLDDQKNRLSLEELKILMTIIMPVVVEGTFSTIADGITHHTYGIDGEKERRIQPHFRARVEVAREKLKSGYIPKVQISLTSKLFPFHLLLYYVNYLQSEGFTEIVEVYEGGQTRFQNAKLVPSSWNKSILFENLRRFFKHFPHLYHKYIQLNFPLLKKDLELFDNCQLVLFILVSSSNPNGRPHIQCYRFENEDKSLFSSDFFQETDPGNPFKKTGNPTWENPSCIYNEKTYNATSMTVMDIKFMLELLPTYALIQKHLKEKMEKYLRSKSKN